MQNMEKKSKEITKKHAGKKRGWWLWLLIIIVLLGWQWHTSQSKHVEHNQEYKSLAIANKQLQNEVHSLKQKLKVANSLTDSLEKEVHASEAQIASAQTDLAFYRHMMGQKEQFKGLKIRDASVKLIKGSTTWQVAATLTHDSDTTSKTSGSLKMTIKGTVDGEWKTLEWKAIRTKNEADTLHFDFNYFDRLETLISLPEGFVPHTLIMQATPEKGKLATLKANWQDVLDYGDSDSSTDKMQEDN